MSAVSPPEIQHADFRLIIRKFFKISLYYHHSKLNIEANVIFIFNVAFVPFAQLHIRLCSFTHETNPIAKIPKMTIS